MNDDVTHRLHRPFWRRLAGSALFHLAAAVVAFGLVLTFIAKPYWVPTSSMENTLRPGDRILVNRLAYAGSAPANGDVVVFDADSRWEPAPAAPTDPLRAVLRWLGEVSGFGPSSAHTLVKRVIGTPGQTVACCDDDGAVQVDGAPLDEPYVTNDYPFVAGELDCSSAPRSTRCFAEVTVPDDSYLVLGDNRANSADSAVFCRDADATADCWRWATRDGIVGRAAIILWPIARWSGL